MGQSLKMVLSQQTQNAHFLIYVYIKKPLVMEWDVQRQKVKIK